MFEIQPGDIHTTPPTPPVPNFNWTIILQSLYIILLIQNCLSLLMYQTVYGWSKYNKKILHEAISELPLALDSRRG